ncbi:hypothetical protein D3C85_1523610 [compost metagenome]
MGRTPRCSGPFSRLPTRGRVAGSHGMAPNRFQIVDGSRADRSRIQPKKGAWRISMVTNSTLYRA